MPPGEAEAQEDTKRRCRELLARAAEELQQASDELELLKHDFRSVGAAPAAPLPAGERREARALLMLRQRCLSICKDIGISIAAPPRDDFVFIEDAGPAAACPPAADAPFLLSSAAADPATPAAAAASAATAAAAAGRAAHGPPRGLLAAKGECPINRCLLPANPNPNPNPNPNANPKPNPNPNPDP